MKLYQKNSIVAGSALVALGLLTIAPAAVITRQPSIDMYNGKPTDESFINTNGTLAVTINCTSATNTDPTVNGVPFVSANFNAIVVGTSNATPFIL